MADALATVTAVLTGTTAHRRVARSLRAALYRHAFNPHRRNATADPATANALAWLERASLPIQCLADPHVTQEALDALAVRLDGQPAAANTIARKRAVFHGALAYAAELGLLPANPLAQLGWKAPAASAAVSPLTVASPAQVHTILAEVSKIRPELSAFFGCLYYAALRPEEAVALRTRDLVLPAHGWGRLILTRAYPRTGSAWTSTGTPYQPRGLKHRPDGAIRIVPVPPVLAALLRQHLHRYGHTPDGRLFRSSRGGILSESVYGRIWQTARRDALGPDLAATPLARRPYDLRHAALSLWLNATGAPAEVAARAANSVHVLHTVYTHCLHGQQDAVSQQIEHALNRQDQSPSVTASGSPNRSHRHEPVRYMSVNGPRRAAHHRPRGRTTRTHIPLHTDDLSRSEEEFAEQLPALPLR